MKELERQIKIKNEYCKLICDLAYDYDGCGNNVKELKELIDEIVDYARAAINNDDKRVMYMSCPNNKDKMGERNWNILHEEL